MLSPRGGCASSHRHNGRWTARPKSWVQAQYGVIRLLALSLLTYDVSRPNVGGPHGTLFDGIEGLALLGLQPDASN